MIELKEKQIIQTRNSRNYILKHVLTREGGVTAVAEDGYEYFIKFKDFKVVIDTTEEAGN